MIGICLMEQIMLSMRNHETMMNEGFAYSSFKRLSLNVKILLHFAFIIIGGCIGYIKNDKFLIAAIIGGISNLVDRIIRKSIRDWINFGSVTINIADIIVVFNVILFGLKESTLIS